MNLKVASVIAKLQAGETVENREGGNSMVPLIYSNQPVTISPVDPDKLEKGDIVYVKVRGNVYTHKVLAVRGNEVQIGNNKGGVNGWTGKHNVYGIVTHIEGVERSGALKKVKVPEKPEEILTGWLCPFCGGSGEADEELSDEPYCGECEQEGWVMYEPRGYGNLPSFTGTYQQLTDWARGDDEEV